MNAGLYHGIFKKKCSEMSEFRLQKYPWNQKVCFEFEYFTVADSNHWLIHRELEPYEKTALIPIYVVPRMCNINQPVYVIWIPWNECKALISKRMIQENPSMRAQIWFICLHIHIIPYPELPELYWWIWIGPNIYHIYSAWQKWQILLVYEVIIWLVIENVSTRLRLA